MAKVFKGSLIFMFCFFIAEAAHSWNPLLVTLPISLFCCGVLTFLGMGWITLRKG